MSLARIIDLVVGALFVVLGIWGLIPAAGGVILGLVTVNTTLCIVFLALGALLLYGALSTDTAHSVSGTLGIVTALVAIIGLFSRDFFGLMPMTGVNIALFALTAAVLMYDWLFTPEHG